MYIKNIVLNKNTSTLRKAFVFPNFYVAMKNIMSADRGAIKSMTNNQAVSDIWNVVPMGPADPILGVGVAFRVSLIIFNYIAFY